ncbi:Uncharacterized protein Fot_20961 [Forsythia ovata]|uniref:Uncharacterized protein n=1 Tax=Forsythia ovata TaxID=205694 RepID=A0ABD1UTH3_9LAMI
MCISLSSPSTPHLPLSNLIYHINPILLYFHNCRCTTTPHGAVATATTTNAKYLATNLSGLPTLRKLVFFPFTGAGFFKSTAGRCFHFFPSISTFSFVDLSSTTTAFPTPPLSSAVVSSSSATHTTHRHPQGEPTPANPPIFLCLSSKFINVRPPTAYLPYLPVSPPPLRHKQTTTILTVNPRSEPTPANPPIFLCLFSNASQPTYSPTA